MTCFFQDIDEKLAKEKKYLKLKALLLSHVLEHLWRDGTGKHVNICKTDDNKSK